jgi:hypothetical protein
VSTLLWTFRNQQVTCNHSLNDVVYGYKKPRYIQRFLALLLRGLQSHNDAPALSCGYGRNFQQRVNGSQYENVTGKRRIIYGA